MSTLFIWFTVAIVLWAVKSCLNEGFGDFLGKICVIALLGFVGYIVFTCIPNMFGGIICMLLFVWAMREIN